MMAGLSRLILGSTCALLLATGVQAGLLDGNPPGDFLPVEDAFLPSVLVNDDSINVRWDIAEGYYLYKHALKFELSSKSEAVLATPQIPDGEKHVDDFFGEVETYRNQLTVTLPFSGGPPSAIQIVYQGCADAGLCYPPQTQTLDLGSGQVVPEGSTGLTAQSDTSSTQEPSADTFVAEQDRLAGLISSGNLAWTLISFLGLGILLAFTPCVLPMIPILSGIIVGRGDNISLWRGFSLSCAYVLAMALAYTFFGVLAGIFGANLQAALQSPWVLVPFALLFVVLALAMFGVYELQVPSALQTRLNNLSRRSNGGLAGAALMGFAAALIVGPCLAPPLAGALLYIGSSGDAVLGGAALFALGIGMGLPLIILGTAGAGMLPKAGAWMEKIKVLFGVILLGVAIWLLTRIVPSPAILALWAVLLAAYGVYLGALESAATPIKRLAKAAGLLSLIYATILLVGAAMGATNPLRPLQDLGQKQSNSQAVSKASAFKRVSNRDELFAALETAAREQRPAVVDFYADWCVECVHMERTVFNTEAVQNALAPIAALQIDITDYNAQDRDLLKELGVIGPPTILFYDATGDELKNYRLIGEVDAPGFVKHLQRALDG